MRGRRPCRGPASFAATVLGILAALVPAPQGAAQDRRDDEPVVIGQRRKTETFHLDQPKYELTLFGQFASDERETPDDSTEVTELRFEESAGIKTRGYIVHPNLVDFKFDGVFGLTQSEFEFNGEKSNQNGTLSEFDFLAEILKLETTHYTAYARQTRDLIHQQFSPSLETTTTTYGGTVETLVHEVNMRLDAFHLESVQEGLDLRDFTYAQNTVQFTGWTNPTQHQRLRWEYLYEGTDQQSEAFGIDTQYDKHEVDVEHEWKFGERQRHHLDSELHYSDQTGDFPLERLTLTEQLRLQHTDAFRTDYLYRFQQQSRDEFDQDQHLFEAKFEHRLYRSLRTNGRVGAALFDSSDGAGTQELFANLDVEYEKIVPKGLLTLDAGLNFSQFHSDAHGGGVLIFDAAGTFQDPQPIIIFGQNINPNSIVITSPTGILYADGKDYIINSAFPDRVEILRVPTGRIANGGAVLIDYELGPAEESDSTTSGFYVGGRYAIEQGPLKGLSFFTRYAAQTQEIDPEGSGVPVSDFTDFLYGTEYQWWSLTLRAEQQIHDAEIVPFDATRFIARLVHRMRETTVTGDASYSLIDYKEPVNRVELWTASAAVQHRLSRELQGTLSLVWRDQTDDLSGHTQGFEQQFELNWKHRQTEVFMLIRNSSFDSEDLNNDFQLFQVGIRREF